MGGFTHVYNLNIYLTYVHSPCCMRSRCHVLQEVGKLTVRQDQLTEGSVLKLNEVIDNTT